VGKQEKIFKWLLSGISLERIRSFYAHVVGGTRGWHAQLRLKQALELCSWASHFTLTLPLSTLGEMSHPERRGNTPSGFMLQKPGSALA